MYWRYTTAPAGTGLRVRAANPNRTLAAIPVTVTDLIERRLLRRMVMLLIALANWRWREPHRVRLNIT